MRRFPMHQAPQPLARNAIVWGAPSIRALDTRAVRTKVFGFSGFEATPIKVPPSARDGEHARTLGGFGFTSNIAHPPKTGHIRPVCMVRGIKWQNETETETRERKKKKKTTTAHT